MWRDHFISRRQHLFPSPSSLPCCSLSLGLGELDTQQPSATEYQNNVFFALWPIIDVYINHYPLFSNITEILIGLQNIVSLWPFHTSLYFLDHLSPHLPISCPLILPSIPHLNLSIPKLPPSFPYYLCYSIFPPLRWSLNGLFLILWHQQVLKVGNLKSGSMYERSHMMLVFLCLDYIAW